MDRSSARNILYTNLSSCYTFPVEDIHSWMTSGRWIEEMREALHELTDEIFEKSLSPLFETLRKEKDLSVEMKREYIRLFVGEFSRAIVSLNGSAYLGKEGQVSGSAASEMVQFYSANDFVVREELKDFPDHIANEFEFMATLTKRESEATGSTRIHLEEEQMKFFSRFILPWVPALCERIEGESVSPFYRSLGKLTLEFIEFERNYLGIPEEMNSSDEKEIRFSASKIRGTNGH